MSSCKLGNPEIKPKYEKNGLTDAQKEVLKNNKEFFGEEKKIDNKMFTNETPDFRKRNMVKQTMLMIFELFKTFFEYKNDKKRKMQKTRDNSKSETHPCK